MNLHYIDIRDGKKRIIWSTLMAYTAAALAVVIAAAEGFWYFLTGGFSPLFGGFALVAGILMVIRVVGADLAAPAFVERTTLPTH